MNKLLEEVIANIVGWIAGLVSIDFLDYFFIQKSWKNVWGAFSKRTAVDANTYSLLEWILTALIGFIVMIIVNRLVRKRLVGLMFSRKATKDIVENQTSSNE